MNYSKVLILALSMVSATAFGMQPLMSSSLPQQKPAVVARETQSTETAVLFNAISKGDAREVEKLLNEVKDAKALANAFDSRGWSALMRAANHPVIVHLLLAHGAAVNQTNTSGIPPLREAMIAGNIESIKELIRAGADVDKADNYGITPLMMAVSQGPADAAFILIEAGANVNAEDRGGQTVWKYSNFSSPRKVSPEQKAKIQALLEAKNARKESIKKAQ